MLTHITIDHFITIEHADIELNKGLCVITGDTGAGKSILMQAIGFALAEPYKNKHPQTNNPSVTLCFTLKPNPNLETWLTHQNITLDDDQLLIRRSLNGNKSRYFVNNVPCTRASIQTLGPLLLHIHGQHQSQKNCDFARSA